MTIPVKIAFQNMDSSPAIEARVTEKVQGLERFAHRIIGCEVVVEAPHRHRQQGKIYKVRVGISVPGQDIHVTRGPGANHAHEDVYVAIRDAFDAATRQLEDQVRRMRSDVKTHQGPLRGVVARLFVDENYGFITHPELGEIYFHANSVAGGHFKKLRVGSPVRLSVAEGESPHGLQATTVTLIGKHHPAG